VYVKTHRPLEETFHFVERMDVWKNVPNGVVIILDTYSQYMKAFVKDSQKKQLLD